MISPVMPTYARAPLEFERGEGSWLIATDGRKFLDFGAGIAVTALGHAHPKLVAALEAQGRRVWHVSNLYEIPEQRRLAERLVAETFADTCFFTNSGTEAGELAIKMARKWGQAQDPARTEIICFEGAFHGRSTGAIAAAGGAKLTEGFGPLMPDFVHLPWGDHEAFRAAVGPRTAAVMIEPIQGEGGIRVLPRDFLRGIRQYCDENGCLLVLDEVQAGMGRTGALFAHEHAEITPDIMMVAKGIGGGFPLGAVVATEAAAAPMVAGTHGSTYGGNPLACAVGFAVLDEIAQPAFLETVRLRGSALRQGLAALQDSHPDIIEDVRGEGLMMGLKIAAGHSNAAVTAAARDAGLLVVPAAENVVRILPALTISEAELADGVSRLDQACGALRQQGAA
ncbi:MAG: aspartate aminotransferase family protein [Pseudomonadota bacterium]